MTDKTTREIRDALPMTKSEFDRRLPEEFVGMVKILSRPAPKISQLEWIEKEQQ